MQLSPFVAFLRNSWKVTLNRLNIFMFCICVCAYVYVCVHTRFLRCCRHATGERVCVDPSLSTLLGARTGVHVVSGVSSSHYRQAVQRGILVVYAHRFTVSRHRQTHFHSFLLSLKSYLPLSPSSLLCLSLLTLLTTVLLKPGNIFSYLSLSTSGT